MNAYDLHQLKLKKARRWNKIKTFFHVVALCVVALIFVAVGCFVLYTSFELVWAAIGWLNRH